MPSVLYTASTFSHILNFHLPYLRRFRELGWQVEVACGGPVRDIPLPTGRCRCRWRKKMSSPANLQAASQLRGHGDPAAVRPHHHPYVAGGVLHPLGPSGPEAPPEAHQRGPRLPLRRRDLGAEAGPPDQGGDHDRAPDGPAPDHERLGYPLGHGPPCRARVEEIPGMG